tara:strand:+ start:57628 stop:58083 length:456 start_codon:yes stop_codon:yes gene_type:complete
MKEFKLEIDKNTFLFKFIRYIATLALGISIGIHFSKIQNNEPIYWLQSINMILLPAIFSFFPGKTGFQYLHVDENGISLLPEKITFSGHKTTYKWDKISKIQLEGNHIKIDMIKGSSRKLKLPFHTKKQRGALYNYLKEATEFKQVEFKDS